MVALYGSHPVLLEWHTLMLVARGMAAMLLSLDHKFLVVSGLLIRLNVAPHGVSLGQLILSFVPLLPCSVKWLSDNQNVVRIIQNGSKKPYLQDGAISIFETCFENSIKLEMDWVPRDSNEKADQISRIRDFDDWRVNPVIFQQLYKQPGARLLLTVFRLGITACCHVSTASFGCLILKQ